MFLRAAVRSVCMSSGDGSTFLTTPNLLAIPAAYPLAAHGASGSGEAPVSLALLPVARCPGAAVTVTEASCMLVPWHQRCRQSVCSHHIAARQLGL